jgi:serine/threonine-protein kinase
MGIHSGPVNEITDLNAQANIAGAGINIAQRVMDCGDAGHILLSRHVGEDLEQYPRWRPLLHDLGECEVKHGVRIGVVNLSGDGVGNAATPKKFETIKKHRAHVRWAAVAVALVVLGAIVGGTFFFSHRPTTSALRVLDKSIAVLPFENLSEEKANAFFADGMQDEVLTDLARIADLKVISRTSVMHYKTGIARNLREIGQQLGVANVVEGSVQRSGNRVRVNAQLVDARTDRHLWAQTYDRDLADVFAIQSEIAKTIADQLQAKLSPNEKSAIERPPTSDIAAFDLYARAKTLIVRLGGNVGNQRAIHLQAVELLNQAVARDPSFFDAYCQLAWVHDGVYILGYDHTSARLALADAAVQAAARLRPDAGETHLARGQNLYQGYLDYGGALSELDAARRSLPNDPRVFLWKGLIERRQGKWEQSIRDLERGIELDPRNFFLLEQTAQSYQVLRRYAQEKATYDRVLAFEPGDPGIKAARALADLNSTADTRPLHEMIDSLRGANPAVLSSIANEWLICALAERDAVAAKTALIALGDNPANLQVANVLLSHPFVEGIVARISKDDDKARAAFAAARAEQEKIVQAQPNYGLPLCVLGLIDAALGRKEEALREGRRAVELLPPEKDALDGSATIKYLAMIAAWVGDKDLALAQLEISASIPSGISYGELKLDPDWDPLRGDPRFEKIVASLAPKERH